ncbi:hypothetical protein [Poseidonibacter ostreae]|uniref:Uncharacterized protein n=1 Tax=Poseidonibacter ostreae TaxID=2654171 RepID=A0A6L4WX47_9BACT|nr:hypothetical protein [Poseidonibacter ostreae]KAB7891323.1 hypothetical protein GBG19_00370 [Poseidonibacter ostreae]
MNNKKRLLLCLALIPLLGNSVQINKAEKMSEAISKLSKETNIKYKMDFDDFIINNNSPIDFTTARELVGYVKVLNNYKITIDNPNGSKYSNRFPLVLKSNDVPRLIDIERAKAKAEKERLEEVARAEVDRLKIEAKTQADRLKAEAKIEADRLKAEAKIEKERLEKENKKLKEKTTELASKTLELDEKMNFAKQEAERLRQEKELANNTVASMINEAKKIKKEKKKLIEEKTIIENKNTKLEKRKEADKSIKTFNQLYFFVNQNNKVDKSSKLSNNIAFIKNKIFQISAKNRKIDLLFLEDKLQKINDLSGLKQTIAELERIK